MKYRTNRYLPIATILTSSLLGITTLSYISLTILGAFAIDNAVDDISITVPTSCSLTSTLDSAHTETINIGTNVDDIGTTTIKVFCNDSEGFAIYAAGYTGDVIGGTNSNKLIGTNNQTSIGNIDTGIATSGATSNWSMKLIKVENEQGEEEVAYNPANLTIESDTNGSFANYHVVPNEYTKVASFTSTTDATLGSVLQTTYQAYISPTQAAGTYAGKVIYTLVHPATAIAPVHPDQIGVNYNANGLSFTGGNTTNNVVYAMSPMYIATTPLISKTNNIGDDGTQNGSYQTTAGVPVPITATGATKMKVVIRYGFSAGTMMPIIEGNWDGSSQPGNDEMILGPATGTATYIFNGDAVTFFMMAGSAPSATDGQDYGYFAEVYPIYATEQPNTEVSAEYYTATVDTGTYATTTTWNGRWYAMTNDEITWLTDESAVINYLSNNSSTLLGTTIDIYAYNPYTINYNGNNATAGTMTGFYTTLETTSSASTADLMAPNFKRTGYGFAGWSENQNATVNSNDTIYGPNEKITGSDLTFDTTRTATLYAVWVQSAGDMQTFSCSSLNPGQITALTDTRDNNVYTVGKMQDGNCWMMENLRLDNTATITSANTNNPATGFTSLSATSDTWCKTDNSACYDQSMLNTNNTNIGGTNATGTTLTVTPGIWDPTANIAEEEWNEQDSIGNTDHNQWYGYGNYYNWYSATAGNGTYSAGFNVVVTGDICPTNWHLPNGGTDTGTNGGAVSGGFFYLDTQLGGTGTGNGQADNAGEEIVSNRWRSFPNNFLYSGGWIGSSAYGRGDSGYYLSRTAYSSSLTTHGAYGLNFYSGAVNHGIYHGSKSDGLSVRCLAQ